MLEFENALDTALASLQGNGEDLEEILSRYPEYRDELRPLLLAAQRVKAAGVGTASEEFRTRTRNLLGGHMRIRSRRPVWRRPQLMLRYAASFAVLALALVTSGFALAQSSVPGGLLYPWKLASEQVWRNVHANRVYVDLELTQRRLNELIAVQDDPVLSQEALDRYAAALDMLEKDVAAVPEKAAAAREALKAQKSVVEENLGDTVGNVDELFHIIPSLDDVIKQTPQEHPQVTPTEKTNLPLVFTPVPSLAPKKEDSGQGKDNGQKKNWVRISFQLY